MSLEDAVQKLAGHLARQEFVEVYAHHDADGIAAGSILCTALLRKNVSFRLRVLSRVEAAAISPETPTLLCDFGSGEEDLPAGVMVVDHHIPRFGGEFHVNPRLFELDGDRELSAAGTAFLVAQELGDNRDLAGLVLTGVLGDGQELAGMNLSIFNEAVAQGVITTGKGLLLPGRDDHERLFTGINPYLHQVSGDEVAVADLLDHAAEGESTSLPLLLSLLVLRLSPSAPVETLLRLYGQRYDLEREVIADAHTFTAVVDACGKSGRGGLAASLCMRSPDGIAEAWKVAITHRTRVVEAIRAAPGKDGVYEVGDVAVASDVADALANDFRLEKPVLVVARSRDLCHISARTPRGTDMDIGDAVHEAALQCGGFGGGHRRRAGATIACTRLDQFREHLARTVAA
jgi:hypothetical protein